MVYPLTENKNRNNIKLLNLYFHPLFNTLNISWTTTLHYMRDGASQEK